MRTTSPKLSLLDEGESRRVVASREQRHSCHPTPSDAAHLASIAGTSATRRSRRVRRVGPGVSRLARHAGGEIADRRRGLRLGAR